MAADPPVLLVKGPAELTAELLMRPAGAQGRRSSTPKQSRGWSGYPVPGLPVLALGGSRRANYWIELATAEKMLFDWPPINFSVPTTMTRITASMTAYSATS
jgi:hypothetical protein